MSIELACALSEAANLQSQGLLEAALSKLEDVITHAPGHVEALSRKGWILNQMGRFDMAISAHEQAAELAPASAEVWANYGLALQASGARDEALRALQNALRLNPQLAESRINLGLEWQARGQVSLAVACYRQAIADNPALVQAWINLAIALQEAGEIDLACAAGQHAIALQPANAVPVSNLQMTQQYAADLPLAALRRTAMESAAVHGPEMVLPHTTGGTTSGRIRVGYVSGDLYAHPVGWMAVNSLRAHDRSRFEVHCFAEPTVHDALTEEIRHGVEHWHSIAGLSDEAVRVQILACGVDVLVDLAGHTARNRLGLFAKRAAPVQLTWLGYAASTGLPTMDGIILGSDTAPIGCEEAFCEPVLRTSGLHFGYRPPDYAPPIAPPHCLKNGDITFGSFNNLAKMGWEVVRVWARVLHEVPNSRLLLKTRVLGDAHLAEHLRRRFSLLGIAPDRIELRGASPHAQMLAEYGDIDIALDPFPFCGGLTTCEALWMGVPVVTLPWLRPMSRQGLAILKCLELEDLIASTSGAYVAIAAALARDQTRRVALRMDLRARMERSALMDGRGLAGALETLYMQSLTDRATA